MATHTGATKEYAPGTNDAELLRLGVQHRLWSQSAFSIWERAGVTKGKTVLDAGCGPGYTSFDIAGLVTETGKVIAIDESTSYIEYLKQWQRLVGDTAIDARVGDVQHLDLPHASVNVAYQRWVLCFVKDPDAVIRGVADALKPGGTFAIQDYVNLEGGLVSPESRAFRRLMAASAEAWNGHGGDSRIGLRLPSLLSKHGFDPLDIRPLQRIARSRSQLWNWPTIYINTYAPKLVEEGRLTKQEHEELLRDWEVRTNDPNAFFLAPAMVEILAVKK